jgi:catechol 2,3-dioxygenase-like lactoylglutathione lyase family enzyme
MEQRVSLVTLGVADLARSRAFYERLGWRSGPGSQEEVVFFQAGGMVVALWDRALLAQDSGIAEPPPPGAVALAYNVRSPAEVDAVLEEVAAAGAHVARPGTPTSWGGYSGLFHDPDGHPWEVAHNPFWRLDEDGRVRLGE